MSPIGALEQLSHDLLWSLWAEMGASGVVRRHQGVAIDPEILVLYTPGLVASEPRLEEMAFGWCVHHGETFLTRGRLTALSRGLPPEVQGAYATFSARLAHHGGALWDGAGAREAHEDRGARTVPVRLDHPSMVRCRARLFFGLGARPDVICEVLARADRWLGVSDLSHLGYTRRTVLRILTDLAHSGVLVAEESSHRHTFRLSDPGVLADMLEATDVRWPEWHRVMPLVWHLVGLDRGDRESAGIRRVRANEVQPLVSKLASELWLVPPPKTSGNSDAFEALYDWGRDVLSRIAAGEVPVGAARNAHIRAS